MQVPSEKALPKSGALLCKCSKKVDKKRRWERGDGGALVHCGNPQMATSAVLPIELCCPFKGCVKTATQLRDVKKEGEGYKNRLAISKKQSSGTGTLRKFELSSVLGATHTRVAYVASVRSPVPLLSREGSVAAVSRCASRQFSTAL